MGYIRGEGRNQGTLFPVVLDDLVPSDHVCRVIEAAFVDERAADIPSWLRAVLRRRRRGRPEGYGSAGPSEALFVRLPSYDPLVASFCWKLSAVATGVELMWLLGRALSGCTSA